MIYVSKKRRKKDVVYDTIGHYDHYVVNQRYHLTVTDVRLFFENLNRRLAHDYKDVVVLDSI